MMTAQIIYQKNHSHLFFFSRFVLLDIIGCSQKSKYVLSRDLDVALLLQSLRHDVLSETALDKLTGRLWGHLDDTPTPRHSYED